MRNVAHTRRGTRSSWYGPGAVVWVVRNDAELPSIDVKLRLHFGRWQLPHARGRVPLHDHEEGEDKCQACNADLLESVNDESWLPAYLRIERNSQS